ncbi:HD-GYP domain-containing protein [Thauera sp. ZXT1-4]|uniref:HD-GYP domain-containing protein n=1 Tax=Thauera sp. ZXT1-4 TaxID=3460294 RepID=UPI004040A7AC
MRQTIATRDLRIGMFIADIDRPWEETPFLMQGFLLRNTDQLRALQNYCRTVVIDRLRSTGDQFSDKAIGEEDDLLLGREGGIPEDLLASRQEARRFLCLLRDFKGKIHSQRLPELPPIDSGTRRSELEAELRYMAPIVDDVFRVLREVRLAIDGGGRFDAEVVQSLVNEMAGGLERNPDALLWLTRLKRTDQYSYDHAVNVSVYLMIFGRFVGFDSKEVRRLGFAGLLQDLGKIQIDYALLRKAGPLTTKEFEHVKAHVTNTLKILRESAEVDREVLAIVGVHHERYDGSGYPRGLWGMNIPLPGEMSGIVDTYCAMTQQRVYSDAVSSQHAMETLNRLRGKQFRDVLVDQFIQCIGLYPIGTLVELNTGEVAVVIQQNQVRRLRPTVLVLLGPDKTVERFPRTLNLLMQPATPEGLPYRITQALPPDSYGIDPADFYLA